MDIPLVADLFWSQILADWARGSVADLFIVGSRFLTQMGTTACFAAAGSARIDGAGDYRLAEVISGLAICGNQAAALAGRGLDLRPPHARRLNLKDLRPIRGLNLRRSAIKKNREWRGNFWGPMRGGGYRELGGKFGGMDFFL